MLHAPVVLGHEELSRDQLLLDRGLHYGDGLFETIACVNGVMPFLENHLARLERDAIKLLGSFPAELVQARLDQIHRYLGATTQPLVIKLLVTRGVSGRGYAYQHDTPVRVYGYIYPYTPPTEPKRLQGINVIFCRHRLADRGWLGSIKHCNRLDQIIARDEVSRLSADEGLMFNDSDHLVEATSANVAVLLNDQWLTPDISGVGIAGVARELMIERGILTAANISQSTLASASAMAVINSVHGVLPVAVLANRTFNVSPQDVLDSLTSGLAPHMRGVW